MSRLRLAAPPLTILAACYVFIGAMTRFGCEDGLYVGAGVLGVFVIPPVTGLIAGLAASRVYKDWRIEAFFGAFLVGVGFALLVFLLTWVLSPLSDCAGT